MNQMTVRGITTAAHHYTVTGEGYSFDGQVQRTEGDAEPNLDHVMFAWRSATTRRFGRRRGRRPDRRRVVRAGAERRH